MSLPSPKFRRLLCAAALALGCTIAPASAEVDTLPALKQFDAADVLDLTFTMKRETAPITIGKDASGNPIAVDGLNTLTVCSTAVPTDCGQPYVGAALKLRPGATLKVTFDNQLGGSGGPMAAMCMDETGPWSDSGGWASAGGLGNQHFHGLLVPPKEGKPGDATKPFGDFILTCTSGSGATAQRSYQIAIPATHPRGIDWFHPHIHGIAKPQVASGMAGMILIDEPACSDPTQCSVVRPILLRDIQLVQVQDRDALHWVNFADQDPGFCGGPPFAATNLGSCALPEGQSLTTAQSTMKPAAGRWIFTLNGAQYPTIVANQPQVWRVQNASSNITYRLSLRALNPAAGDVVADAPFEVISLDGAGLAGASGTGPLAPETREILLMPGSRADLRVRRPEDGGTGDLIYQLVNESFQAGFAPDDADIWPHVALARIVFPAPAPVAGNAAPPPSTLETPKPLRRAGRTPSPDRVHVTVEPSEAAALRGTPLTRALASRRASPPGTAPSSVPPLPEAAPRTPAPSLAPMAHGASPAMVPAYPESSGARMARWLQDNCDGYENSDARAAIDVLIESKVPGHHAIANKDRHSRYWQSMHFDPRTTHRRIYFGIQTDGANEQFALGETFISTSHDPDGPELIETDLYGRPISPSNPVVLTTFNPHKGLCALKRATVEQWELVNVSKEVHNFHVHQMKFTVARDDNGQPIMRAPSALDLVQLPASLLLTAGGSRAELQHDTIIVPRGVTDCRNDATGKTSLKFVGTVGGGAGMHPVEAFILDRSAANTACTGLDRAQRPLAQANASPDGSGMIFVNIALTGAWLSAQPDGNNVLQPARFVFHCHILEHEDKGMMHRIAVLDPSP
ncbi:multicopper oxidase domain-containing protein [Bradyrhizobium sp. SRS-191]|uniref:multicopper oxidase domain-containing protein n=1 Tax=Bradyrhizobium sp. SRS-191 TaxID=2962606 RepID=UPI00211F21AC|nr:multicopper oxidase domain-containing protein [Bradyrhizobium sp. SRS-191]